MAICNPICMFNFQTNIFVFFVFQISLAAPQAPYVSPGNWRSAPLLGKADLQY